ISGEIPSFIDSFFETVSGFTTTGASILTDVESKSHGILFWRSFTHWVGGMGVLVLMMAIFPTDTGRTIHIMRAEMPGPIIGKLVPKIKSTAKILYLIYIVLTATEALFLLLGGMSPFESIVYSLGTAGTGGFGIKSDGLASYTPYQQWVITVFMVIFGINFNLYYLVLTKKVRSALKSEELWFYLTIVATATVLITVNIYDMYGNTSDALRNSAFQVASLISTTGYATADFNLWPTFSKGILFLLMFTGACAGSTAGGLKLSRVILLFKSVRSNLKHMLHTRSVESIRFEGKKVDNATITNVASYFALYMLCIAVILLLLCLEPFDLETNISAAVSCFNNIGPGFSSVGPMSSYAEYSDFAKLVLSCAMLLGRLEIYPMLLMFSPTVWRNRIVRS
ncbi:MAG: TrkH family potassium uptake protein, partial [Acutalibacteraceae bacterium]|nr:TrkH family potassium uptake protein [Acutalibacteraceae bacterium]